MQGKRLKTATATIVAAVLLIVATFLIGCVDGPNASYKLEVSKPYDVKDAVFEMKVNTTVELTLDNSGNPETQFTIENLTLTGYEGDGTKHIIIAEGLSDILPADETRKYKIEFDGVPVRYILTGNPPRLKPIITHYDFNASVSGKAKILFIWTPEKKTTESKRIDMKEIDFGDYMEKIISDVE